MAGIQVLRVEVRNRVDGPLAAHILGRHRPPTAVASRENTVVVGQVSAAAEYAAGFPRTGPKGGRPAKPGVEFVVAGPPPYGPGEWSREQEDVYFSMALAWIVACAGPHSMISAAAIHRDETSPHMQVLMVPVGERKGMRRLGWSFIRDRFCPGPGPAAKRMSRMQDFFHAEVGRPCGLARGEKGSIATHEQIDRAQAAEARSAEAERRAQAAEAREGDADERVSQLRTSAQAAVDARDEAEEQRELEEEALAEARAERERQDSAAAQARAEREQDEAAVRTLRREIEAGTRGWTGRRAAAGQALIRERNEAVVQRAAGDQVAKGALANQSAMRGELNQARARDAERRALKEGLDLDPSAVLTPSRARELVEHGREADRRRARDKGLDEGLRALDDQLTAFAAAFGENAVRWLAAFREWRADRGRAKGRPRSGVER